MMEAGPSGDRPRGWGRSSEMDWIDGITDRLSHLGDNSARTMFGGHSLYWRGVIFAIAHRKRLYLKVEDQSKPAFEDRGMGPLRPNERKTVKFEGQSMPRYQSVGGQE